MSNLCSEDSATFLNKIRAIFLLFILQKSSRTKEFIFEARAFFEDNIERKATDQKITYRC
jgi:hypothetical protein